MLGCPVHHSDMHNPAEHIYIGPFMWVLIIAFIFFYM